MTELVRYEAARRALAEAVAVDEVAEIRSQAEAMRHYARQAGDKTLEIQSAQLRFRAERKLGELIVAQKETVGLNAGSRGQLRGKDDSGGTKSEQPEDERPRLADIGIDRKLSSKAQKLAALDVAAFEQALERHADEMRSGQGRVAMDLLKVDAEERGRVHRRDLASALSSAAAVMPSGRLYPASYIDPPWRRQGGIGNRAYENHYTTMPWPEILDYLKRAGEALLPDAWAWMWIPRAHLLAKVPFKTEVTLADGECVIATVDLPLAYACQLALGMDAYSTCYVWTKTDAEHPDVSGSGLLVWDQDELLLQFKRGKGLPKPESSEKFGSNHRERPREHSRKPDFYRQMIATMVGRDSEGVPLPVLELFARVDAEHPLPEGWDAWGNQAGVSAISEIPNPTSAATSPSSAGAGLRTLIEGERPHKDDPTPRDSSFAAGPPSDAGENVTAAADATLQGASPAAAVAADRATSVRRTEVGFVHAGGRRDSKYYLTSTEVDEYSERYQARETICPPDHAIGISLDPFRAACSCGALFWFPDNDCRAMDAAIELHFIQVEVAARDDRAPYDDADVVTIDQLAGSEWLAPTASEDPPFDPATIGEREALKLLSDFCHRRRDIAPALGEFYHARGFAYRGAQEWSLTGKGWDRLRELEAAELPLAPAVLTEPYRAPQPSLFDLARQIDDTPPAEVIDGALQTRLPVDDGELAEQLALIEIAAGNWRNVDPEMRRHLVGGREFAHCTTDDRILITDEGRAFLAQLAAPASIQQQGAGT